MIKTALRSPAEWRFRADNHVCGRPVASSWARDLDAVKQLNMDVHFQKL